MGSRIRSLVLGLTGWVILGAAASLLAASPPSLPLPEDERYLALLNCATDETPAGWTPVAQWTFPGGWPKRPDLRAYHGVGFVGGAMSGDSMGCQLGWYRTVDDAREAYANSGGVNGRFLALPRRIGERAAIGAREPEEATGYRFSYDIVLQRGAFLFRTGISSSSAWPDDHLWDWLEAIDCRLTSGEVAAGAVDTGVPWQDDPRRPKRCDLVCPLHGIALTSVAVPIRYGLPGGAPAPGVESEGAHRSGHATVGSEYPAARARLFPSSPPEWVDGGCAADELLPTVWMCGCGKCLEVEAEWRAQRGYPARTP